ncbi:MAG: 4Fe-4S ferredoxin [Anaerolineales bacterium]|nr:MAG: 4Fe-4S ferredoxin [Anaerolineales bacterium]
MKRNIWQALIRPSTIEFYQEGKRTPGFTFYDFVHGYVYGRWPYLYIGIGTGEHFLAKTLGPLYMFINEFLAVLNMMNSKLGANGGAASMDEESKVAFADTYHGKVVPLASATRLVSVNEDIKLKNLEKVIPYTKARDIILQNPDHILALECPCRSARENPCLPLDVCLIIGDPFANFIETHHPNRARRITQREAAEILKAENQRGHVHHAFFKDAILGRFYAICNCCACCCGAMQAHQNGTPMLAASGYVSQVEADLCIACEDCVDTCQFGAISINDYHAMVNEQECMGCGVCESICVQGAHTLMRAPAKGEPLEITELIQAFESKLH